MVIILKTRMVLLSIRRIFLLRNALKGQEPSTPKLKMISLAICLGILGMFVIDIITEDSSEIYQFFWQNPLVLLFLLAGVVVSHFAITFYFVMRVYISLSSLKYKSVWELISLSNISSTQIFLARTCLTLKSNTYMLGTLFLLQIVAVIYATNIINGDHFFKLPSHFAHLFFLISSIFLLLILDCILSSFIGLTVAILKRNIFIISFGLCCIRLVAYCGGMAITSKLILYSKINLFHLLLILLSLMSYMILMHLCLTFVSYLDKTW